MGFTWVTEFDCTACGVSEEAAAVEYDRLGYPVCPECGESAAPAVSARHDGAGAQPSD